MIKGTQWLLIWIAISWLVVAGTVLGVVSATRHVLLAADRPPQWEIMAYRAGKDLRADEPNIIRASQATYESREACRHDIPFIKVQDGMRLRCDRVEGRMQ